MSLHTMLYWAAWVAVLGLGRGQTRGADDEQLHGNAHGGSGPRRGQVRLGKWLANAGYATHVDRSVRMGRESAVDDWPEVEVDMVFTYVNLTEVPAVLDSGDMHMSRRQFQARYTDHGELRFSLAMANLHVPWVRRIFVVTNGEMPSWFPSLAEEDSRLSLVNHADIMDPACLHGINTSFSSNQIDMFLHRIPGLAEHFIYSNDDQFVSRPLSKSELLQPMGTPAVALGTDATAQSKPQMLTCVRLNRWGCSDTPPALTQRGNPWEHKRWNANRLMLARFGKCPELVGCHHPVILRRSLLVDMWRMWRAELLAGCAVPYRNAQEVYFVGLAVQLGLQRKAYQPNYALSHTLFVNRLQTPAEARKLLRRIHQHASRFVCLQNATETGLRELRRLWTRASDLGVGDGAGADI